MEDKTIVSLYLQRSQEALVFTERQYGRLLRHIADNILADSRDVEEAVQDAYMRLWDSIPPEQPASLAAYSARLTRNAAMDILRKNRRKKRDQRADVLFSELEDCIPSASRPEEGLEEQELVELINRYLATLDAVSRSLFVRRYFSLDELGELSTDFGLTRRALTARLYRIRQGLKSYLIKEGVTV